MAFLTPDKVITAAVAGDTITIKQKITPDSARKPDGSRVKGKGWRKAERRHGKAEGHYRSQYGRHYLRVRHKPRRTVRPRNMA